jgi:hypothetical protein
MAILTVNNAHWCAVVFIGRQVLELRTKSAAGKKGRPAADEHY